MDKIDLTKQGFEVAQEVVDSATSYLCRAISSIRDKERIKAFNVMYTIMRIVDDLIDERENSEEETLQKIKVELEKWKTLIDKCYLGDPEESPISLAFFDVLSRFPVPREIWDNFFYSMKRDLEETYFETFEDFEKYCIGTTCSPTILYLFILLSEEKDGKYTLDDFDYIDAGKNLGMWAYIVHILRDVKKDVDSSLFYLPEKELEKFELTLEDLVNFSKEGKGNKSYENFLKYYLDISSDYYNKSIKETENHLKKVSLDRSFAVLGIIRLYEEISKRLLDIGRGIFSGVKPLSKEESQEIVGELFKEMEEYGKNRVN